MDPSSKELSITINQKELAAGTLLMKTNKPTTFTSASLVNKTSIDTIINHHI